MTGALTLLVVALSAAAGEAADEGGEPFAGLAGLPGVRVNCGDCSRPGTRGAAPRPFPEYAT